MAATTPKDKARTGRGCYARPIPSLLWPSPSLCAAETTFTQARATSTIELAGAPDASHPRSTDCPKLALDGPLLWLPGRLDRVPAHAYASPCLLGNLHPNPRTTILLAASALPGLWRLRVEPTV